MDQTRHQYSGSSKDTPMGDIEETQANIQVVKVQVNIKKLDSNPDQHPDELINSPDHDAEPDTPEASAFRPQDTKPGINMGEVKEPSKEELFKMLGNDQNREKSKSFVDPAKEES